MTDPLRRARLRSSHVPVRTCVGCRRREDRSALLRVVARTVDGVASVVPDEHHRLPGRGAWLHPETACLELAVRRRAFGRALRVRDGLDAGPLRQWFENRSN